MLLFDVDVFVARGLIVNCKVQGLPIDVIDVLIMDNHRLGARQYLRLIRLILRHVIQQMHILRVHLVYAAHVAVVDRVWHGADGNVALDRLHLVPMALGINSIGVLRHVMGHLLDLCV